MPGVLPDAVPGLDAGMTGATLATDDDPANVDHVVQNLKAAFGNINWLGDRYYRSYDATFDPGFSYLPLVQPNGVNVIEDSIIAGPRYRFTAPAGNNADSADLRVIWAASRDFMGDSEVRSTWYAQSSPMSDAHGRFQPGHAHRVTADVQVVDRGFASGAELANTLEDVAKDWAINQWVGDDTLAQGVEFYVTMMNGPGQGQTVRIAASTETTLIVSPNWTEVELDPDPNWTGPRDGEMYKIWCQNVRAITLTQNVFFNAHARFNAHVWDGSAYIPIGGSDFESYLKPGGTYEQFPWHVKSKVVGRAILWAVWLDGDPEPEYDFGSDQTGLAAIPPGWDRPGMSGLVTGHLAANDWLTFDDDLVVIKL